LLTKIDWCLNTLIASIALRYVIPIVDDEIVIGNICVFVKETYIVAYTYMPICYVKIIDFRKKIIHA
jgi:hypothetical protein